MSLHYNADNSCLFVNGKKIFNFEAENKKFNFPVQFGLENICDIYENICLNNGIIKYVNVNLKVIVNAEKIIVRILVHLFVRTVSI